jgi:dTDP-glucose 4,6-dehydratase
MRVVVTGAAGLIGSHLVDALLARGDEVIGVDNLLTGQRANLSAAVEHPGFTLFVEDVTEPGKLDITGAIDAVCHLASAASPSDFSTKPVEILRAGSIGTFATLELARRHGARYLLASTSEVYGEPLVHPQREEHWGNVNPVGPRACYDESKRFAEATVSTYSRTFGVNTAIVRIFNTYGPRMRVDDGRVVSNFVVQALRGQPLTVHGDGSQTRSFCFVDDQVRGLLAMLDSEAGGPVNLGNPNEFTVLELAKLVLELTGSTSGLEHLPLPQDDPTQRRPDISLARQLLGFVPCIELDEGLPRTVDYFRSRMGPR